MSFMCTLSTFVEVVPRVPLHLARGFILFLCDSIQAHACGRPASRLSLMRCTESVKTKKCDMWNSMKESFLLVAFAEREKSSALHW
jgi:hypothetical protein